jgi:hypothetical protein
MCKLRTAPSDTSSRHVLIMTDRSGGRFRSSRCQIVVLEINGAS